MWPAILQFLGCILVVGGIPLLLLVWGGYALWRRWPSLAVALVSGGLALGVLARLLGPWFRRRSAGPASPAISFPPLSPRDPPAGRFSGRPPQSLPAVQKRAGFDPAARPENTDPAIQQTLYSLTEALAAADAALREGGPDALNLAAEKLVYCRSCTGLAWAKSLTGATQGEPWKWIAPVRRALQEDARPIEEEVARRLAAQPEPALVRRPDAYVLPCAACGADALTFQVKEDGLSCGTLLPSSPSWQGEAAKRLADLLTAGGGRALLDYLAQDLDKFEAYCPECGLVYCHKHFHWESEWSGTWLVGYHMTCPLGHSREI